MKNVLIALALAAGLGGSALAGDWWETVKFKGDLRYRHEMIDEEGDDARHRHRLRARIGLQAQASDYTTIGIQLATGSDDPVSTNQTLDNAFSTKDLRLDLAYFATTHPALPGLTLTAGKFKNPFFKPGSSELLWDSDWNPEGGVLTYEGKADKLAFTLIGAGLWIDERASDDDSWLGAAQGVARYYINQDGSSVAVGAGFFNYVNAQGFRPFFDADDPMGNSVAADSTYATDFELLELYLEATHKFGRIPVTVMGDYVTNTAADSLDHGWLLGLHVGKTKKPGSWALRYIYREVKKDALVGMFTDSDFRGGGTDARGHEMGGSLQLTRNTAFNVTYFINEVDLEAADQSDFNRLQVDLQLKF